MSRRALRRAAAGRVDMRAADVAEAFLRLTNDQKSELILVAPEFYFAAARYTRMRQITLEADR